MERQVAFVYKVLLIAETLKIDDHNKILLLTVVSGDRFHEQKRIKVWTPVVDYTLACSTEFLVFVGGTHDDGKPSTEIQVFRLKDLTTRLYCDLELRKARSKPAVAFCQQTWDEMIIYGGYSSDGDLVDWLEIYDFD